MIQDITILSDKRYDADFFDNTMSSRDMTVKEIKWTHGSGSIEISEDRNYFTVTGSGEVEIEFLGGFYDGQSRTGHYYVSEVN